MKKLALIVVTALLLTGCKQEEENYNLLTIDLIATDDPTFFSKTVILYEDDDYRIKTNFDTYIAAYPFDVLEGYDDIEVRATQDSYDKDVLLLTDYLRQPQDLTYILANHLENGSCLLFNKNRNEVMRKIEMEEYHQGEPMAALGGRRFYIGSELFLETIDFIT
jgi:5S rRNA maturation endonuclease (ribonuclease M5)